MLADALGHAAELARRGRRAPGRGHHPDRGAGRRRGGARRPAAGAAGASLLERDRGGPAAAAEALARTPEQLPVLAQAGVVDAGGAGFLLLLDALLARRRRAPPARSRRRRRSRSISHNRDAGRRRGRRTATARIGEGIGDHAVGDLRYEVMYLLDAPDDSIADFKEVWAGIGDSIVVVGGDGLWNCHIHTDDIGAAIEAGVDAGRPQRIRVTDLVEQVEEERWVREGAEAPGAGPSLEPTGPAADAPAWWPWSPATGSAGSSAPSACTTRWSGGQSMNPSTADLVEAVEAVGSDEVVILPNNKNIRPGGRAGRRPDRQDGAGGAAPGASSRGSPPCWPTTRRPTPRSTWPAMGESAARVVPAEITRAVRDTTTDAGEVREGDWIGVSRDGVMSIADSAVMATRLLLSRLLEPTARARHPHRGGGGQGGRHPPDQRVAERGVPRRGARGPPRRPAALPVPARPRVGRPGGGVLRPDAPGSEPSAGGRARHGLGPQGGPAGRAGASSPCFDLLTTFPRRYIDRTRAGRRVGPRGGGRRPPCWPRCARVRSRRARNGRTVVDVVVRDDTGTLDVVFFNQPWRAKQLAEGTEAIFWGKVGDYRGQRQMVNPVVDVVAGVDEPAVGRRRRTLRILPVYPASAKAGLTSWEIGTFVEEALERAGELADPLPERVAGVAGPVGPDRGLPGHPRARDDGRGRRRPGAAWSSTSSSGSSWPWSCAGGPSSTTPGPSATRSRRSKWPGRRTARWWRGSWPACPSTLTRAQRQALAVIVADLAGPFPMHRLLQGDVGSGKTVVALAALLAAVQSGHQGALMVPTEVLAEQHDAAVRPAGDAGPDGWRADVRVELLTSRVKGKARARSCWPDLAGGDVDDRGRHPRPADRGGRVPLARRRGDRRAAPLRRRAAGRPAGQGRRRATPTCWS